MAFELIEPRLIVPAGLPSIRAVVLVSSLPNTRTFPEDKERPFHPGNKGECSGRQEQSPWQQRPGVRAGDVTLCARFERLVRRRCQPDAQRGAAIKRPQRLREGR